MDEQFSPLSQPELPIEVVQGATFVLPIKYEDEETGLPIDLTDYSAEMQVRQTAEAGDPAILTASTENGRITITALTGEVVVTIPAVITAALPGDWFGVYDLFIKALAGSTERLISGPVYIAPRVTR